MEWYSALKGRTSDTCTTWINLGHYVKQNKAVAKGEILYESTYMKFPVWSNSQRQKVGGGFQGLGEVGCELVFHGDRISIWDVGLFWRWIVKSHNDVNALNTTEPNTFKWSKW